MLSIEKYLPMQKNTLIGMFDVNLGGHFLVRGWTYHIKNNKQWVRPPAKAFGGYCRQAAAKLRKRVFEKES